MLQFHYCNSLTYGWHAWNLSWPIRIQQAGKTPLSWIQCKLTSIEVGQLFSLKTASNIHKKEFIIPKTISDCKMWKLWNILSLQASNLVPMSGNSCIGRRVLPGRIIALLFWTKYAVPYQIKPTILKLTIRRGQSNISIVFLCVVGHTENYYYRMTAKFWLLLVLQAQLPYARRVLLVSPWIVYS